MPFFPNKPVKELFFAVLLLLMLVLLAGYAIAGWQSRYLADDYCYDAQFIKHGFWQGQVDSYLNFMPYSSNRYSLTLFSGLAWLLGGVRVMPILPGAAILLWGLALFYSIRQGIKYFAYRLPITTTAFIAATLLFYTLLLASARYQILFWRSGLLPYLVPLILNTFLIGRVFFYLQHKQVSRLGLVELGIISWVAAGFSETVFALQAGFWGLALLLVLWRRQANGTKVLIAILIGTFIGAALLMLNPTNAVRQSPFPPPPPVWTVALTALQYAKDFFFYTVRGTWLPLMALLSTGLLLGWLEFPSSCFHWRKGLVILVGLVLGTGLLLPCIMAPTIWSMSSYPDPRGLLPGTYLINIFFFTVGIWIGAAIAALLQDVLRPNLRFAAGFLLMVVLSAYSIRFIRPNYNLISTYENRAKAWDMRNAQILQARAEGQSQVVVGGIDAIATIFELQPNENHWVNRCAAAYYRLDSIITTE